MTNEAAKYWRGCIRSVRLGSHSLTSVMQGLLQTVPDGEQAIDYLDGRGAYADKLMHAVENRLQTGKIYD
jgi:hypothetical protein